MSDLIERAGAWLSAFHNKGGVIVPEDSYLALIRDLAARLARCEAALKHILDRYDAYRRRGVAPAPVEYQDVVRAYDVARAYFAAREKP